MFGWFSEASDFGFALEARQPLSVLRECLGQDLDRNLAASGGVGRAIDLTHAARAEQRGDFIGAETGAGREAHPFWWNGRIIRVQPVPCVGWVIRAGPSLFTICDLRSGRVWRRI